MNLYSEAAAKDGNDPGISAVNRRTAGIGPALRLRFRPLIFPS